MQDFKIVKKYPDYVFSMMFANQNSRAKEEQKTKTIQKNLKQFEQQNLFFCL